MSDRQTPKPPLITREERDRLHGPECRCPWHRPELHERDHPDQPEKETP